MFEFGFIGDHLEDFLLPAELFENLIVIVFIFKNSLLFAMKKIVSFDGVMLFSSVVARYYEPTSYPLIEPQCESSLQNTIGCFFW